MSVFIVAAVAASVLWMFAIAWLLDVLGAQRKELASARVTLRLYRETRTDSDRQIRELLGQNERLARHLIDRAADLQVGSDATPGAAVMQAFCRSMRES